MSGIGKYLIDTNILIYFFDGKLSESQKERVISFFKESFNISIISKIEFLGFKEYLDKGKLEKAKEFISNAQVVQFSNDLADTIIDIKQKYNTKLGDAVIGATALKNSSILVTRNQKDFEKIEGLRIINPWDEENNEQ
jgi:predicted nucleic acid-binding protein